MPKTFFKNWMMPPKAGFLDASSAWAFFFALIFCALPTEAFAADITLGKIICNVGWSFKPLARLMSGFAYIGGAALVIRGVMFAKKHTDNPNDSQIVKAIAHFLAGACLLSLPTMVGTLQKTIHIGVASGTAGLGRCDAVAGTGGANLGLDVMMTNFVTNIKDPMTWLVSLLGILVGIFYIYKGLLNASKVGSDPRAGAPHTIIVHLIVGAILVSIGTMVGPVMETIFGTSDPISVNNIINWEGVIGGDGNFDKMENAVRAMLTFVKIIGAISFLRGWMILKKAVEGGQATIPQGVTHIIGGAMAINIGQMLKVFDATFGTQLVN